MNRDKEQHRMLEEAGWEPEEVENETIWRNPKDGNWYEQDRAIQLLTGGEDVGSSD